MYKLLLNYPYILAFLIMITGLIIIITSDNLIKKVFGLNIFQASVIIFYLAISKIKGGIVPVIVSNTNSSHIIYTNPLPQVLMLTAIVVGIALTSVAFAIITKIKENYNTISENELNNIINKANSLNNNINYTKKGNKING